MNDNHNDLHRFLNVAFAIEFICSLLLIPVVLFVSAVGSSLGKLTILGFDINQSNIKYLAVFLLIGISLIGILFSVSLSIKKGGLFLKILIVLLLAYPSFYFLELLLSK